VLVHLLDGRRTTRLPTSTRSTPNWRCLTTSSAKNRRSSCSTRWICHRHRNAGRRFVQQLEALDYETLAISAVTHQDVHEVVKRSVLMLDALGEEPEPEAEELPVYQLGEDPLAFTIERLSEDEFACPANGSSAPSL